MERLVIAEPMTVFTNFLLAAFAGWIAWRLRQPNGPRMISRRLWALGIALQGLGAFAGGIYHGFAERGQKGVQVRAFEQNGD